MEPSGGIEEAIAASRQGDYSYVSSCAQVAVYDDLLSAPRILEVSPAPTAEFIEGLTTLVFDQASSRGGRIPYTVVREVAENFIHADFREIIVSIMDGGNTIRFADQGPGIEQKEKAQMPGFSSAVEPMKRFIRGVGSGLPIVREYLGMSHGRLTIEDNLRNGAVVTISLVEQKAADPRERSVLAGATDLLSSYDEAQVQMAIDPLSPRERAFLKELEREGALSVTELSQLTGTPMSSTHVTLRKLEEAGLAETTAGKKRRCTPLGRQCARALP